MRKLYFLCFTFLMAGMSFGQDLIITGAIDGPLPGGFPKGIELYVVNDIADLSVYGLERAGNGDPSSGAQTYTFPADSYSAGDFIYVGKPDANSAAGFAQYLNVTLNYESSAVDHNGNDAIILYFNGAPSDVFGEVGVNGSGESWECKDGWAYRNDNSSSSATFSDSEWTFSGPDALDGCDDSDDTGTNADCASVFPVGTFSTTLNTETSQRDSFKMFPNPTNTGIVTISSLSNETVSVQVFDILGKQVKNELLLNNTLTVSDLNTGVYILKLTQNNASVIKKLVIK